MLRPRPYLSFSQMTKFEMSPERFIDEYVYGKKQRISRNMAYGSQFASGLEREEASGDPALDVMAARLPKFERMDRPIDLVAKAQAKIEGDRCEWEAVWYERDKEKIWVPVLPNGDEGVPLLAIPDTMRTDMGAFKEYKTSVRPWTQKMADDSGQVTFYATTIWLIAGAVPEDIELVNVPVRYEDDGRLSPTGELVRLPTRRTMVDVIKMTARIKRAWAGIKELCENELI